ncbi:hypothetical protein CEY16_10425 [Halalkalibacillus sediminis]|uniref:DUF1801 domain-containing protein n=1 Tax=Halalkalibacillus sediminis TaxID=2018042 RepID=A0A2I0QSR4_9BACI|nr:hypothetical protein [Halalkalibacillus sediminis]PKR77150.1 hypothetical protein CEY16_10425 [Halalkalibacillus sediminis]
MSQDSFETIFEELKSYLKKYEEHLVVQQDTDEVYYLDSEKKFPKNNKPYYFGSVHIKKNYVSYYLMPVYMFPDLLEDITPELRKRMQGKSCFNFKKYDDTLFKELENLTSRSFKRFEEKDLI